MLRATHEQLVDAGGEDGDVCAMISAAREFVEIGLREELQGSLVEPSDPGLIHYLKLQFGSLRQECLYVVFVDRARRFIHGEPFGFGTRVGVESRLGHLFRRAVELRAAGLLLAHNHPSGDCTPSAADRSATARIDETASRLDLELLDHLIVTASAVFSIKREQRL